MAVVAVVVPLLAGATDTLTFRVEAIGAFGTRSLSGNNGHFKSGNNADISGVRSYSKRNLSNGQAFKSRDRYADDN